LLHYEGGSTILLVDEDENDVILMEAAFKKAAFIILQVVNDGEAAIAISGALPLTRSAISFRFQT